MLAVDTTIERRASIIATPPVANGKFIIKTDVKSAITAMVKRIVRLKSVDLAIESVMSIRSRKLSSSKISIANRAQKLWI